MKVVVLTVVNNAEKYIENTIISVLNQTHKDYIYYVCDNGSTDNTGKIIRKYASKYRQIKYLHNDVNDFQEAFNNSMDKILENDFDYFFNLDGDDTLPKNALEILLNYANNDGDIIIGNSLMIDEEQNKEARFASLDVDIHPNMYGEYLPVLLTRASVTAKLYHHSVIVNLKFSPYTYGADSRYFFEAGRQASHLRLIKDIVYYYRIRLNSVSFNPKTRLHAGEYTYHVLKEFCSDIGYDNDFAHKFIVTTYINTSYRTLMIIWQNDLTVEEKIHYTKLILEEKNFKEAFKEDINITNYSNSIYSSDNSELKQFIELITIIIKCCATSMSEEAKEVMKLISELK